MFIMKILKKYIKKALAYARNEIGTEKILLNQGKILSSINQNKKATSLSDYEWTIFSQWGEDGIIDFLVSEVEIKNKNFIEFGIEDFSESNCRFLMMNSDWKGFVIDGSENNIKKLQNSYYYWKYDLQAESSFIDKDNINALLEKSGFDRDLGILSVDIDGNDYHVLETIDGFDPRIIICEFNAEFGTERAITVPYDSNFFRTDKHYSNLYFGASIKAICLLLNNQGYTLIGTGVTGANAFFVKNLLMTEKLKKLSKSPFCFSNNARQSRDIKGNLNFLNEINRYKEIKGLDVINTITKEIEQL